MNTNYTVSARRVGTDAYEFTTRNSAGDVVSTVRKSGLAASLLIALLSARSA